MRVLIISANPLPASPAGPAYVAGAALAAGHTVEVFETLFSTDVATDLEAHLRRFDPDVIGISIRVVNGYTVDEAGATLEHDLRLFDSRLTLRVIVDCIKRLSDAQIVLGGPGFNYFGPDWLTYLDLDYGLRGEAERSFPLLLDRLESGGDITTIPGCIVRQNGAIHEMPRELIEDLDATALPAYQLFDLERYKARGISAGIFSKRGCALNCSFCPYSSLEGKRYRLKSPGRVVDEVKHVLGCGADRFTFCENSFNVPRSHAAAICHELIDQRVAVAWGHGGLKPLRITDDFIQLMQDAGCDYLNLALETASPLMLTSMKRRYRQDDVRTAIDCFRRSDISYGLSLLFGCPGETPQTIAETLELVAQYPPPPAGIWVSIGICLWTEHQALVEEVRHSGQFPDDGALFNGAHYISPDLPEAYMRDLIEDLSEREGYTVQVNKAFATHHHQAL